MKTLADFKRDVKSGKIKLELVERFGKTGEEIPAKVEAKDKAEALLKIATYCTKEGYFPDSIEVICLFDSIGIIEV